MAWQVPESILLTPLTCLFQSRIVLPLICADVSPLAWVACFLLEARADVAAGRAHRWAAYVAALPETCSNAVCWSETEVRARCARETSCRHIDIAGWQVAALTGSPGKILAQTVRREAQRVCDELAPLRSAYAKHGLSDLLSDAGRLSRQLACVAVSPETCLAGIRWAVSMWQSRAMHLDQFGTCLAPFVDLANHCCTSRCWPEPGAGEQCVRKPCLSCLHHLCCCCRW